MGEKGTTESPKSELFGSSNHAQAAIEHQEFFLNNQKQNTQLGKEQSHDIVIGAHESSCRTCGEKWPKKEPEKEE